MPQQILKFQPQRKHGSVEVEFWVGFGLMLGHLEPILGLCCAIYVGIPSLILANEWELHHLCPKKAA